MDPRSWLEAIARTPETAAVDAEASRAVTEALEGRATFPEPAGLLAASFSGDAARLHLAGLGTALAESGNVARERAQFHATWLRHLLDPEDTGCLPLVTVVISVYNAAHLVGEAVASALAQTWPALEVVVVDDGSQDDPAGALAEAVRGGRVRVVRQENRGAAAARNAGVAEARGVFVHFLDADDTLDTDSVERKLAAFRAVPEAELCVSRYRSRGGDGPDASAPRGTRLGDAFCPTRDLLATWVRRYPFQTSTVLVQRWVLLEVGPWNEDFSIPHSDASDSLYWFRLGLRGTSVVALDAELGTRLFREGSLITHETPLGPILFLTALIELLDRPSRWPYLGPLLVRMQGRDCWSWIETSEHPRLLSLRDALLERVRNLGRAPRERLSGKPPLLLLRLHVPAETEGESGAYRERLAAEVNAALRTAAPPGEADLRLWLGAPDAPLPPEENAPALAAVACWLESCAGRGVLPVPRAELPALAVRLGRDPRRRGLVLLGRAPTALAGRLAWRAERATRRFLKAIR
jgi:glycosyltransferase involved in cell wall biosynthesis